MRYDNIATTAINASDEALMDEIMKVASDGSKTAPQKPPQTPPPLTHSKTGRYRKIGDRLVAHTVTPSVKAIEEETTDLAEAPVRRVRVKNTPIQNAAQSLTLALNSLASQCVVMSTSLVDGHKGTAEEALKVVGSVAEAVPFGGIIKLATKGARSVISHMRKDGQIKEANNYLSLAGSDASNIGAFSNFSKDLSLQLVELYKDGIEKIYKDCKEEETGALSWIKTKIFRQEADSPERKFKKIMNKIAKSLAAEVFLAVQSNKVQDYLEEMAGTHIEGQEDFSNIGVGDPEIREGVVKMVVENIRENHRARTESSSVITGGLISILTGAADLIGVVNSIQGASDFSVSDNLEMLVDILSEGENLSQKDKEDAVKEMSDRVTSALELAKDNRGAKEAGYIAPDDPAKIGERGELPYIMRPKASPTSSPPPPPPPTSPPPAVSDQARRKLRKFQATRLDGKDIGVDSPVAEESAESRRGHSFVDRVTAAQQISRNITGERI